MKIKRVIKIAIACCWLPLIILSEIKGRFSGRGRRLTILYYHAVTPENRDNFAKQMAFLHRHFDVVWADRREPLKRGRPAVAITFDDAFRSVGEQALPVLRTYAIPAIIFVPTGYLGRRPGWELEGSGDHEEIVMAEEELCALPGDLVRLGSHTVSHPRLSRLAGAELNSELTKSRVEMERICRTPIHTLAFPHGDYDEEVLDACARANYETVYSVTPEAIRVTSNQLVRGRTAVEPSDYLLEFALKARGAYGWMPWVSAAKRLLATPHRNQRNRRKAICSAGQGKASAPKS